MTSNKSYIIIVCLLTIMCNKPIKHPAPTKYSILEVKTFDIILECTQKSTDSIPFVELSLIIKDQNQKFFIATVYGSIREIYHEPPQFAPPNTLCGISIGNDAAIHYFFVCLFGLQNEIIIQSAKKSYAQPNINNYNKIITVPCKAQGIVKSSIVIINDR